MERYHLLIQLNSRGNSGQLKDSVTRLQPGSTLNTILHTEHNLVYHPSSARPRLSTRDNFASPGETWPCPGAFLIVVTWGRRRSYWHPVGRDQGCGWTSYTGTGQPRTELFSQKLEWEMLTQTFVSQFWIKMQNSRTTGTMVVQKDTIRGERKLKRTEYLLPNKPCFSHFTCTVSLKPSCVKKWPLLILQMRRPDSGWLYMQSLSVFNSLIKGG